MKSCGGFSPFIVHHSTYKTILTFIGLGFLEQVHSSSLWNLGKGLKWLLLATSTLLSGYEIHDQYERHTLCVSGGTQTLVTWIHLLKLHK